MSHWTIFSNHGHVLICLARNPDARLRDVAADVGLTERAVQKIVRDLQQSGMISVSKQGRRNSYRIDRKTPLRHDLEAHCRVGALVDMIGSGMVTHTGSRIPTPEYPDPPEMKPTANEQVDNTAVEPVIVKPAEFVQPELEPEPEPEPETSPTDKKDVIERQQGSLF